MSVYRLHISVFPQMSVLIYLLSMGAPWVMMKCDSTLPLCSRNVPRVSGGSDTFRPVVVPFESLNFLNWDAVGHILTEKWCESAKQVKSHGHQIAAVVLEGSHWLPLWAVPAGMVLVFHTFDDIVDYDIFDGKLRWMGLHLGFEEVVIHRVPHGLPSHNFCGAHALAFLAHILIDAELPDSVRTLDFMATNMRASFVQAMFERRMCICPLVWGDGGTGALVKSIAEELGLHGVPGALTEQRASQAIKAIGSEQLIQAMQQKQPWRQMKALATNVGFKWVLPSELEAAVAGNKGKPVGKKPTKERNVPGVPPPVEVDPHKLSVLEGTFRSGPTVLPQLCAQQIGPVSSGVVLMTAQEADPYLKAGRLVSQEPLALVVFHRADQPLQSMLSQLRVTFPAVVQLTMNQFWQKHPLFRLEMAVLRSLQGLTLSHLSPRMSARFGSMFSGMKLMIGIPLPVRLSSSWFRSSLS